MIGIHEFTHEITDRVWKLYPPQSWVFRCMTASNDRLDLEDSHTPENPRLRRIKLPHTISDFMRELMYSD
ncbi:MAG: hypothetical protein AAFX96_06665, partial [Pseudomonadota bacterium]